LRPSGKRPRPSNAITAIPKLLALLELRGCLVTIGAMGCQTAIAAQIVAQGALALTPRGTSWTS
jgi:predicted transposase YbfD/YdcC